MIDSNDPLYDQLRVWVDLNHNGRLDSGENFTLQQLGILSISTSSTGDPSVDQYGNMRWLDGTLTTTGAQYAIYDVQFVTQ